LFVLRLGERPPVLVRVDLRRSVAIVIAHDPGRLGFPVEFRSLLDRLVDPFLLLPPAVVAKALGNRADDGSHLLPHCWTVPNGTPSSLLISDHVEPLAFMAAARILSSAGHAVCLRTARDRPMRFAWWRTAGTVRPSARAICCGDFPAATSARSCFTSCVVQKRHSRCRREYRYALFIPGRLMRSSLRITLPSLHSRSSTALQMRQLKPVAAATSLGNAGPWMSTRRICSRCDKFTATSPATSPGRSYRQPTRSMSTRCRPTPGAASGRRGTRIRKRLGHRGRSDRPSRETDASCEDRRSRRAAG